MESDSLLKRSQEISRKGEEKMESDSLVKRSITRREFLVYGLSGATGLLLASCAPGVVATPTSAPAATAVATATAVPAKKVTLTVWTYLPEVNDYFKVLGGKYTAKNPNVTIEPTLYAQRALDDKLAVALPTASGPDIIDGGPQRQHFAAGFIEPLPDAMKKFVQQEIKLPKFALDDATEAGSLYTVTWFTGPKAMFYNKSHFAEAGLTGVPETVDQMLEYARKLTKRDASGAVTRAGLDLRLSGGGLGITEKFRAQAFIPYGVEQLEKVGDKWRAGYDNEGGVNALKLYINALYKDKVVQLDMKHDAEAFELGVTSMFQRESWVIDDVAKNAPDLKLGAFLMPKGPKGWGTVVTTQGLAVTKASKNKEAAWDFIRFCLSAEGELGLVDQTGWIPTRIDVDYSSVYAKKPALEVFIKSLSTPGFTGSLTAPIPEESEISTRFSERLTAAFARKDLVDNDAAIKDVMHAAAEQANKILKDNGHLA